MKLRCTDVSPYTRKVRVVAHELGVHGRIELVPTALRTEDPDFWRANPLAKIPVLTTDDGRHLHDSTVICEYLDAQWGRSTLLPAQGDARWDAMTLVSLSDGIVDAGMLVRAEMARPADQQSAALMLLQLDKMARGLDHLAQALPARQAQGFDLAAIAAACAVGWLVLRFGADRILSGRPALEAWFDEVSQRPSMQATRPQAAS